MGPTILTLPMARRIGMYEVFQCMALSGIFWKGICAFSDITPGCLYVAIHLSVLPLGAVMLTKLHPIT